MLTPLKGDIYVGTQFVEVYNRFLGKITDDMYVELTPEDTIKDLRNMLIDAIPGFEFPRKNLYDYTISSSVKPEDTVLTTDFIIGLVWEETSDTMGEAPKVLIE